VFRRIRSSKEQLDKNDTRAGNNAIETDAKWLRIPTITEFYQLPVDDAYEHHLYKHATHILDQHFVTQTLQHLKDLLQKMVFIESLAQANPDANIVDALGIACRLLRDLVHRASPALSAQHEQNATWTRYILDCSHRVCSTFD
jgi:hypothetical protein